MRVFLVLLITLVAGSFEQGSAVCGGMQRYNVRSGATSSKKFRIPSACKYKYMKVLIKWKLDKPKDKDESHRISFLGRTTSYNGKAVKHLHDKWHTWLTKVDVGSAPSLSLKCSASGYWFSGCDLTMSIKLVRCIRCYRGYGQIPCTDDKDTICYRCPFPTVSSGSQACYKCPNTHVPTSDNSKCMLCGAGSYISNSKCLLCEEGKFNPTSGQTICQACSSQYRCPKGTKSPYICAKGFERTGTSGCTTCQDGYVCTGAGTEGGKKVCPVNHFCKDGNIKECEKNTFCPPGSSEQGPACFGFGTEKFESGTCNCHADFSGSSCNTVSTNFGEMSFSSTEFDTKAQAFLDNEEEGDCPCGTLNNDGNCTADSDSRLTVSTLLSAAAKAYTLDAFDAAIFGFSRAVQCAYELKIVDEARPVLMHLENHLDGIEKFSGFSEPASQGIKDDLYATLVASQYVLALKQPNKYGFNVFFPFASRVETMVQLMSPPFHQCDTDKLKLRFESGCGSTAEDLDTILAYARCALLDSDDLAILTLVPTEVILTEALFCLRSMVYKVDISAASTEILELATLLDERYGPSASTQEILAVASMSPSTFITDDKKQMIQVPPQPILFFEDNIGAKIDSIRAVATRLGDSSRVSQVTEVINQRSAELNQLLVNSFEGLATYLSKVNGDIMKSFALAAETDSASVLADLEATVDLMKVGMKRVENSAGRMAEYLGILNGERVNALINGWKELVEIQYDIEMAQAAIVKAQAALDMIKGIFVGVAVIAATVVVGPLAGAVVSTAASLLPLRRRLYEPDNVTEPAREAMHVPEESALEPVVADLLMQHRNLFGVCGVGAKDVVNLVSKLGAKGKKLAKEISSKMTGLGDESAKLISNAIGTILVIMEAVDLVVPCTADDDALQYGGYFYGFLEGYADRKKHRKLAVIQIVLSSVGVAFKSVDEDLDEVVEPYKSCSRRILTEVTPFWLPTENEVRAQSDRELFVCKAVGKGATKLSSSLARTGGTLAKKIGANLVSKATFGKVLGVASGVLEIASGVKSFFEGRARADEMRAQAVSNKELNNDRVKKALETLRASLGRIFTAVLAIVLRLDLVQLGLPFSEIVNPSFPIGEDAFNFQPAIWDSLFHDIMDLLEYEVLLCPQIEGEGLVTKGRRRALDARSQSGLVETEPLRRSLGPKADKAKAQAELKKANKKFNEVSRRIEKRECPRFERTLRQVVDWGKSVHEGMFEVVEYYRKFEALLQQKKRRDEQVEAANERIKRQEAASKEFLKQFRTSNGDEATRAMLTDVSMMLADSQLKLRVIDTVDEAIKLFQDYCNSHYYINPAKRPKDCQTNPLADATAGSADYEDLLLRFVDRLRNMRSGVKADWFDFAYDGFSDYDDELLTVSELVDWEDFVDGGYSQIAFTLHGPAEGRPDLDNVTSVISRSGPYFCGFDNIGMTSFGVLFFDAQGNVISSDSEDISVTISLSGPFWKTVDGERAGFALKSYDNVPYQYSKPRIVGGSRFCRTDENPTLYGELCDKSRSFQIEDRGLDSQPLPSPYAKWDINVVGGKELLRSRGAAGLAVIASFKATKNDDMLCVAPRLAPLKVVDFSTSKSKATDLDAGGFFGGGFAAGAAVMGAGVLGAVFYRKRKKDVVDAKGSMNMRTAKNEPHGDGV